MNSLFKFLLLAFFFSASVIVIKAEGDATASVEGEANCDQTTENGECSNPDATKAEEVEETLDSKCPSRRHIIACTAEYLDLNKDSKLDREELDAAISKLPWLARGVLKIIGSTSSIMKKCDVDGDDAISMDYDMQNNAETCLATCFKRRAFRGAFFSDCEL